MKVDRERITRIAQGFRSPTKHPFVDYRIVPAKEEKGNETRRKIEPYEKSVASKSI